MIDLEDAQESLAAITQPLIDAHTEAVDAWSRFVQEKPELAKPCDATTRANFIHNHVCEQIDRRVADLPGVEVTDRLGFFGVKVGANVFVRFKYIGQGAPSNVATTQQKLLARQEFTEEMTLALTGDPALDPPTLLTCGYTLDGEKVGRIAIRRDCKGHLPWTYDIFGGDTVNKPMVFDGMKDTAKPATIRKTDIDRKIGGDADEAAQSA